MKKIINLTIYLTLIFSFIIKSSYIFTSIQNILEEKFQNIEHKNHKAYVTKINLPEADLLIKNRKKFIIQEMSQQFDVKEKKTKIPKITVCFSGGGYRAMLTTLGALKSLEEIKILPLVENIYSLSGSTWLMNIWLITNYSLNKLELHLKNKLSKNIKFNLDKIKRITSFPLNKDQYKKLLKSIAIFWQQKIGYTQRIDLIDIWGLLIALNLYPDDLNICNECLSKQYAKLKNGNWPISISTAITPSTGINNLNKLNKEEQHVVYNWLLFSPAQISLEHQNQLYSIPPWAFGREFKSGQSVDNHKGQAPDLPLAYFLGIFGSAFSGSPQEYLKIVNNMMLFKDFPLLTKTIKVANEIGFKDKRVAPAKVYNFLEHLYENKKKQITLIDAGLECNIPLYPILKYDNADIILIFDASTENRNFENISKIISKALPKEKITLIEENNFLLIKINQKFVFYLPLNKFADIIYPKDCLIFTKDELTRGFGQITNFTYDEKQINAITKTVLTNIVNYEYKIREIINYYINK